jgi:hypothetical protein
LATHTANQLRGSWTTAERTNAAADSFDDYADHGLLSAALRPLVTDLRVEPLTDPTLWGRTITDERYAVIATV